MENRKTIFVSHAPPYKTLLDQSSINKYKYEGLKLDKNLGSTSIRRFIENNQPDITLHGHIHESTSISGCYFDKIGSSICINASFIVENKDQTEFIQLQLGEDISFEKIILS